MLGSYKIRTDLAVEARERFTEENVEVRGVEVREEYNEELSAADREHLMKEYKEQILSGDPFYNGNLSLERYWQKK